MTEIAGIPAVVGLDDHDQALEAIAVVKTLDPDGDISYRVISTDGCLGIEAVGMLTYAKDAIRHDLIESSEEQ